VVRTVKSLLNLQKVNQLDVKIALEKTNPREALAVEMAAIAAAIVISAAIIVVSEMIDQEKCIKQLVLIVERNAKSHSSRVETSQLDVENVFKHLETRF